jgi:hypothetical protein
MPKYLKTAFVRDLEKQVMKGELSYTRMLESIQYEVINNYMSKIKRDKIPMTLEDNVLKVALEQGVIENEFNWKLVRERDGLTNQSKKVMWVEWNEDNSFKAKYDEPSVGRSLIMSPFNQFFTWQTTSITEIVEQREDYIKFNTLNSVYELWKLNAND